MKKKIGILTLHLNYGGVELASTNLANMLADKYDVTIINMYKSSIPFKMDERVNVVQLSSLFPNKEEFKSAIKLKNIFKILKEGSRSLYILRKRISFVKRHLLKNDYDYIISSRTLYTKLLNNLNIKAKKIAIEHRHHNNDYKYINYLIRNTNKIDIFVSVSKELNDFYSKRLKCRCEYIPNLVENIPDENMLNFSEKENLIVSVGRLEHEKGFFDLIKVFEKIHEKMPEYKLVIAGDGSLKEKLEEEVKKKNLEKYVTFTGFISKEKLNEIYKKAKLYLMTSFEESFGLVVAEAQSYKVPVITFSSATGAVEILDGTGIVIENRDIEKMAKEAINILNLEKDKYMQIVDKAYKNIAKYSEDNVKAMWEELISEI